jgi:hypothetical protein
MFKEAREHIEKQKPLLFVYVDRQIMKHLPMQFMGKLDQSFLGFLNYKQSELLLEIWLEKEKENQLKSLPGFVKNYPVLLLNMQISPEEIQKVLLNSGNPQMGVFANGLNLKESLGENVFMTVHDFRYMEIFQGDFSSIQGTAGIHIKDRKPYEMVLEMLLQQGTPGKIGQPGSPARFTKESYKGNQLYLFEGIPMGKQGQSMSLYAVILNDYLMMSLSKQNLRSIVDNFKSGKDNLRMKVEDGKLFLYMDIQEMTRKIPMVAPMMQRYGIDIQNFDYLRGFYEYAASLMKANISIHFK